MGRSRHAGAELGRKVLDAAAPAGLLSGGANFPEPHHRGPLSVNSVDWRNSSGLRVGRAVSDESGTSTAFTALSRRRLSSAVLSAARLGRLWRAAALA